MRITVVYFVNVTCTYSSILVKWVSFISGYTNISILVRLCQNAGTTFFYAQSPDFHKPGLCYYPKFLYL